MICAKIAIIFKDTNKYTFMKLIKIDGYWIIVSDEERVKGDIVLGNFPDNPIGIITDIYGEEFTVTCFNGDKVGLAQYDSFKILYSQNPEHNLPSITFSDEVAKELGIETFESKVKEEIKRKDSSRDEASIYYCNGLKNALTWFERYNKDKLFTLEQMRECFEQSRKWDKPYYDAKFRTFEDYIQSLTKQEYDCILECSLNGIKKEGESCTRNNNCKYPNCLITNNSVKVIKIYGTN